MCPAKINAVFPRYKFHGQVQGIKGIFDHLTMEQKLVLYSNFFLKSSHLILPHYHLGSSWCQIHPSDSWTQAVSTGLNKKRKNDKDQRNMWALLSPLWHLIRSIVLPFYKILPQNGAAWNMCLQEEAWGRGRGKLSVDGSGHSDNEFFQKRQHLF